VPLPAEFRTSFAALLATSLLPGTLGTIPGASAMGAVATAKPRAASSLPNVSTFPAAAVGLAAAPPFTMSNHTAAGAHMEIAWEEAGQAYGGTSSGGGDAGALLASASTGTDLGAAAAGAPGGEGSAMALRYTLRAVADAG
jgi:hypothetical protein